MHSPYIMFLVFRKDDGPASVSPKMQSNSTEPRTKLTINIPGSPSPAGAVIGTPRFHRRKCKSPFRLLPPPFNIEWIRISNARTRSNSYHVIRCQQYGTISCHDIIPQEIMVRQYLQFQAGNVCISRQGLVPQQCPSKYASNARS